MVISSFVQNVFAKFAKPPKPDKYNASLNSINPELTVIGERFLVEKVSVIGILFLKN